MSVKTRTIEHYDIPAVSTGSWVQDKLFMGQTLGQYLRSLLTPFNAVAGAILLAGLVVTVMRFTQGLAATTNLNDANPWGLWIGFDVMTGVALAAGGYTVASTVYILNLKQYYPIVRPAILTGLLGYIFVVIGLMFDLGRPWRLPYPIFMSFGLTSVMFSVAWHLFLYLIFLFIEFSPALFEWLGWRRLRQWAVRMAVWATVLGVMLSTLHQAALGGLYLLAPGKLHPLWYSSLLPIYFFISSAFAGLSMVMVESSISHRVFRKQLADGRHANLDHLMVGLARAAALIMFVYFGLKIQGIMQDNTWGYLGTGYGQWFMLELVGFVLLPCALFLVGARQRWMGLIRLAAGLAVFGIVLNRLNIAIFAFNWQFAERYVPRWSEYVITLAIVTAFVLVFRWIVNRMPVLREDPRYPAAH
jgi:Ni/Fe-hydrogenase subunit HybB-like protein